MTQAPLISEEHIRSLATGQSFDRGFRYYRNRSVFDAARRGNLITARVEGSDYEPYRVQVVLDDTHRVVDASCTCPYDWGGICKHIVATLLVTIHEPEIVVEKPTLDALLADLSADQLRQILLGLAQTQPEFAEATEREVIWLRDQAAMRAENKSSVVAVDEEEGIGLPNTPEAAEVDMEKFVELRHRLLDEVIVFVRAARHLPGVTRIALIGSLTTDKVDPKDADLLVTIKDDADLYQLATLGRKLSGHAQSFGRGGEVFLADERNNYLGRTCPWRECGPGIRASCDALHCGWRPYLHDDLKDVKLPKSLVAKPPLELWPEVAVRAPIPDDVTEIVLQPLQQES